MKEVDEKQRYPVQMDESDLKQILSLIEERQTSGRYKRPQILIKTFTLKKCETPLQTEVFEVEMALLKREFVKK